MKTDRQVMEDAISLLEKEGQWCQDVFYQYDKSTSQKVSWCVEGALRDSVGVNELLRPLGGSESVQFRRIQAKLAARMGVEAPYHFNDRETTTQEDVVLMMKRTLEDLDG